MAMGECLAYSSLQADSKVKLTAWLTSWRHLVITNFYSMDPKWTLAYAFAP